MAHNGDYSLVMTNSLLLNMTIERVDFPIMVDLSTAMGHKLPEGNISGFQVVISWAKLLHGVRPMLHGDLMSVWWFGTFFIFPHIGDNHPN